LRSKTSLTVRGVKKLNKRPEFFRYRPLVGLRSKTSLYRYDALLTSADKSGRLACKKRVRRDALLTSAGKSERLACKKRVRRDALLTSADVALRAVKPTLNRYFVPGYYRAVPSGTKPIAIEVPRIILELHGSILGWLLLSPRDEEPSQTVLIFAPFNLGLNPLAPPGQ
jgi:hypothetical protein